MSIKVPEPAAKLRQLLDGIAVGMFTTMSEDGMFHSRPMLFLELDSEGQLWFFTNSRSRKAVELWSDPRASVTFVSSDATRYLSFSGHATLQRDPARTRHLWNPTYRCWFPGGLADPDLALLNMTCGRVEYWDVPSSRLVRVAGALRALLTRRTYEAGDHGEFQLVQKPH